jgi:LysR family transcriptional regulator, glycine cleavage system transcriptional activator
MNGHRHPHLSLDLLRGFHAAARHLSFTRAAQELFLTQPAISREVRTLEEQLGTALFHRVNRSIQLTRAGHELYRASDEALRLVDEAVLRIEGASRTLSITTTVALASTWLVPRLPEFTKLHPEIDLRFFASNDLVDLEREQIDVAVRYRPPEMGPGAGEKLFDYEQFPVCSPALAGDPLRPLRVAADLSRHVLLDFETTLYGRPWFDWARWFDAKGIRDIRAAGSLRFSHYDQVIEAAVNGGGVAVGKRPHLINHLRDGRLVAPLGADGVARMGAFYIEVAHQGPHRVADIFLDWLWSEADRDRTDLREPEGPREPRAGNAGQPSSHCADL